VSTVEVSTWIVILAMRDPVSKAYLLTPHSAGPFALLWLLVFCPAFYIRPHNPYWQWTFGLIKVSK
jgi:hypothetical protein